MYLVVNIYKIFVLDLIKQLVLMTKRELQPKGFNDIQVCHILHGRYIKGWDAGFKLEMQIL